MKLQQFHLKKQLLDTFGKPTADNFEQWFTAANFLGYGNNLKVVRPITGMVNACVSGTAVLIKNTTDYLDNYSHAASFAGQITNIGTYGLLERQEH